MVLLRMLLLLLMCAPAVANQMERGASGPPATASTGAPAPAPRTCPTRNVPLLAWTPERKIVLRAPIPQPKFPPKWTESIRVTLVEHEDMIQDHRYYKPGKPEFKAVLTGEIPNEEYTVELLCMGKGGKPMAVFHQKVRIRANTKSLVLKSLKWIETLK